MNIRRAAVPIFLVLLALSYFPAPVRAITSPVVQEANNGCALCLSASVTMTNPVASGDELVVGILACGDGPRTCVSVFPNTYHLSSIGDSLGSSFALAVNDSSSGVSEIYTAATSSGGSDTVSVSFSATEGSMDSIDVFAFEVSGYNPIATQTSTGSGGPCVGQGCSDSIAASSSVPFDNGDFLLGVVYEPNCGGGSGMNCDKVPPCSPDCLTGAPTISPANGFTSYLSADQASFALSSFSGATSPTAFSASYALSAGSFGNWGPWVESAVVLAPPGGNGPVLSALSSDFKSLSSSLATITANIATLQSSVTNGFSGLFPLLVTIQNDITSVQNSVNNIESAVTTTIPNTLSAIESRLVAISNVVSNIGVTGPSVGTSNDATVATASGVAAQPAFSTAATDWTQVSAGTPTDQVVAGYLVSVSSGSTKDAVLYISMTANPSGQGATYAIPLGTIPTGATPLAGPLRFPLHIPAGNSVYVQVVSAKKGSLTVQLQFEGLPINP